MSAVAEVVLETAPEAAPGVVDQVKLALMTDINARWKELYRTQQRTADALGTTQPNIAALATCKVERFSVTWLILTASRLGLNIEIGTSKC